MIFFSILFLCLFTMKVEQNNTPELSEKVEPASFVYVIFFVLFDSNFF